MVESREEARTPPEPDPALFMIPEHHLESSIEPEYIAAVMDTGPPERE